MVHSSPIQTFGGGHEARFVKYLVDTAGMETFMKLYESRKPEHEFRGLYGASREELIAAAGM